MTPVRSLKSNRDFRLVYARGARARRDGLTLYALRRPESPATRLGIAVGSKAGTAVVRNKLRRRLRAAWRSYRPAAGWDVAVRAGAGVSGRNFQQIRADLVRGLEALGVERAP